MNFLKKIYQNKIVFWVIVIVLVGGGYYFIKGKNSTTAAPQYVTGEVTKGTITSSVTGSGQVSAENQLDIKPSSSAAVTEVDVKQGQTVKAGQRIAVLDQKDAAASLAQAQASLLSAKANYDSIVAGTTDTDLQLAQSAVASAQLALDKANADLPTITQQQQQAVNNAFSNLLNASLQAQPSASNPSTDTVTITGNYTGTDKGQYNLSLYASNSGTYYTVSGLESYSGLVTKGTPLALGNRGLFVTFSTTNTLALSDAWTVLIPNTQGSGYLSANNSYQSALLSQQQALANAQNNISSSQISLNNAKTQLQQKINGSTQAQIEQSKAQLANAQAQLLTAQNNYNNNIITAPFDGVIASLNAKVGQQVSGSTAAAGSTALATLITQQKIVVISLNEVDVSKIKIGNKATLTFDAIDGLVITGTVGQIDSIGTVAQGVVSYNVQISLDTADDRIKTGMSATADIITNIKTDVLTVPNSAVKTNASGSYVQQLDAAGKPVSVTVATGIANDTTTEIVSGLNEGGKVVTQTITATTKTTATPATGSSFRIPGLTGGAARGN